MASLCNSILEGENSSSLICLYFAAVLVLLLLIIMQLWKVGYFMSERFAGERAASNVAQPSYKSFGTSGADVRFSTMMTGANMSDTDGSATGTGRAGGRNNEYLVSGRGEPDFWEISSELGDYKRSLSGEQGGDYNPNAAAAAAAGQAQAAAAQAGGGEWFQDKGWMGGNFASERFGAPRPLGEHFGAPSRLGENFSGVDLEAQLRGL